MKKISLTKGMFAVVDDKDYKYLSRWKWYYNGGYAVRGFPKRVLMHRVIMKTPSNKVTDHINRNKLDNRIINLRICTSSENGKNLGIKKNNTSGVPGVWYNNKNDKWCAEIKLNYNKIWLGTYSNFDDAVEIRKQAEIKYFGKYAPIL